MLDKTLYDTEEVVRLLHLEPLGDNRFRGQSHFMGSPNVFGGQVLGQSLRAATQTVNDRRPHSMHAMFLLPGNFRKPIDYEVERVRDGGSFSTRRVVALQEGRRIFVMSASFQAPEEGLTHQKTIPAAIDPDDLPSSLPDWKARADSGRRPFMPVPVDFRVPHRGDLFTSHAAEPRKEVWVRAPIALEDDPRLHEALFAYVSDYGLLSTSLQPHGIRLGDAGLQIASLDHTIWFHRPFRMDAWLRFEMESPNASGGRGLCIGYAYDREGQLVATLAQEGLIRMREPRSI
ncbi:acyl-CoA thioesterase [Noviherbaspirillum pedocola]|uniref:Acyl-CoA thioesterase 2 n=1 Tax=Noviherbaspirillum pedocola TaxID=2801341 RepID=A0A934W8C5_9BURK|nr:acyl-CoA thioesterase II [Noviherbaspirillum pedocola]MBK4735669.1 acyl-CoA thioesterase II [Noviherbaspirillum pedocola]